MVQYNEEFDKIQKEDLDKPLPELELIFDDLEKKLRQANQYSKLCNLYYNRGVIYYSYGLTIKSLNLLMTQRDFIDTYASKEDLIRVCQATVVLLDTLGYETDYLTNMLAINKQANEMNLRNVVSDTLNNIGFYYSRKNEIDQAERYYKECIEYGEIYYAEPQNSSYLRSITNLIDLYIDTDQYEKIPIFNQKYEDSSLAKSTSIEIGMLKNKMNMAKFENDMESAFDYVEQMEQLEFEKIEHSMIITILHEISELYEQANEMDLAIDYMERLIKYMDKLSNQTVIQNSIESQYGLKKAQLLENLYEDSLTGVLNRAGFEKNVVPLMKFTKKAWQLFAIMDIDYFKKINDTYGHLIGDEVLKELCRRATTFNQQNNFNVNGYFGRYGGDEFYQYVIAETKEELIQYMELFYENINEPLFSYGPLSFPISISCGGIYTEKLCLSLQEWLEKADVVLYAIKEAGRGRLNLKMYDKKASNSELNVNTQN